MSSLLIIKVSGTHYEVGYEIGVQTKKRIHASFESQFMQKAISKMRMDSTFQQLYEGYRKTVLEEYPQYIEEMQGMADGSDSTFQNIFLTCLYEFKLLLQLQSAALKCTDIFVNSKTSLCLAHNEDALEEDRNQCYIVDVDIVNNNPRGKLVVDREKFVCFCYPGMIPHSTFGYNMHGYMATVNYVLGKHVLKNRLPMNILLRACLSATSPKHLHDIIANDGYGVASPVSLNVGFLSDKDTLFHYDIYTSDQSYKHDKTEFKKFEIRKQTDEEQKTDENCAYGYYFYCNMFRFEKNLCALHSNAVKRTKVLQNLPSDPTTREDMKIILGQREIYRTVETRENRFDLITIATAVFDLEKEELEIYVNKRPVNDPDIIFKLKMTF